MILKDVLDPDIYNNFLYLHIGTVICITDYHRDLVDVAEKLFSKFVDSFIDIYGKKYVSHNIHNLKHIVDDVRRFGALDNFSSFPFENKLGMLKKFIRSGNLPLQQVAKRIMENIHYDIRKLIQGTNKKEIKLNSIKVGELFIDNSPNNRWILTIDKKIVGFDHTEKSGEINFLVGKPLAKLSPFFDKPVSSKYVLLLFALLLL